MNENHGGETSDQSKTPVASPTDAMDRRDFVGAISYVAMAGGLIGGYGAFSAMAGRYLYQEIDDTAWLFVAQAETIKPGESLPFESPVGVRSGGDTKIHGNGERTRDGRSIPRPLQRLPPSGLSRPLGIAKQPLLLPLPQWHIRSVGQGHGRAAAGRWAIASRISAKNRARFALYQTADTLGRRSEPQA